MTLPAEIPRGIATAGDFLPPGMYPNPMTTKERPRCFQVAFVANDFPPSMTRVNPRVVPV